MRNGTDSEEEVIKLYVGACCHPIARQANKKTYLIGQYYHEVAAPDWLNYGS